MPGATVISDRPPFYRENAPVGAPRAGDDPASGTTELFGGGGGGGVAKERSGSLMGGGRAGRENACVA